MCFSTQFVEIPGTSDKSWAQYCFKKEMKKRIRLNVLWWVSELRPEFRLLKWNWFSSAVKMIPKKEGIKLLKETQTGSLVVSDCSAILAGFDLLRWSLVLWIRGYMRSNWLAFLVQVLSTAYAKDLDHWAPPFFSY